MASNSMSGPWLSLTRGQEERLRARLDEQLLQLERDARKRRLGPLPVLLSRLRPVLITILKIPSRAPWSDTRVAYLLTLTAAAVDYITRLPLVTLPPRPRKRRRRQNGGEAEGDEPAEDEEECEDAEELETRAGDNMRAVLDFVAAVERGWKAVLAGQAWVAPGSSSNGVACLDEEKGGREIGFTAEDKTGVDIDDETAGNYNAADNEDSAVDSPFGHAVTVSPGAGVDQTSRVRLKSIVETAREKLLAWARPYGNFGGEAMGPDGDEGEVEAPEEGSGWEAEVVDMWKGILHDLDYGQAPEGVGASPGGEPPGNGDGETAKAEDQDEKNVQPETVGSP